MCRIFKRAGLCLAVFLVFSGCAGTQVEMETLHPDYHQLAPKRVAVLPMDNMGVDLDSTPLVRPIVHQRLKYKGYKVMPLDLVDKTLQEQGVLISHDVYGFTPQELGEMLTSDAVVYGTVTEFNTRYAVIWASVSVGVRLEMVDCRTGEILWQSEHYASDDTTAETILILLTEEDIEKALAISAAYSTAFAVLESYRPYAEQAVRECMRGLPPGYLGARHYPWDDDPDRFFDDSVNSWMYREHGIRTYTPPPRSFRESPEERRREPFSGSEERERRPDPGSSVIVAPPSPSPPGKIPGVPRAKREGKAKSREYDKPGKTKGTDNKE